MDEYFPNTENGHEVPSHGERLSFSVCLPRQTNKENTLYSGNSSDISS